MGASAGPSKSVPKNNSPEMQTLFGGGKKTRFLITQNAIVPLTSGQYAVVAVEGWRGRKEEVRGRGKPGGAIVVIIIPVRPYLGEVGTPRKAA